MLREDTSSESLSESQRLNYAATVIESVIIEVFIINEAYFIDIKYDYNQ
jgi:hypothetical protein